MITSLTAVRSAVVSAELVAILWHHYILTDEETARVLKLPVASWQQLKRTDDTPPLFLIGRRVYCRTVDLKKWIDTRAKNGKPGVQRPHSRDRRRKG